MLPHTHLCRRAHTNNSYSTTALPSIARPTPILTHVGSCLTHSPARTISALTLNQDSLTLPAPPAHRSLQVATAEVATKRWPTTQLAQSGAAACLTAAACCPP